MFNAKYENEINEIWKMKFNEFWKLIRIDINETLLYLYWNII